MTKKERRVNNGTPKNIKARRIYCVKNSPQFDCLKKGQKCSRISIVKPAAQKPTKIDAIGFDPMA